MKKEPVKRYSLALKQQVVREYETGASAYSLSHKYGIGSLTTVKRWVKKYGRSGFRSETVVIQTVEDQNQFKEMADRITQLEKALAQAVLDKQMLEATLHVASQELGQDLKKNFGKKSSATSERSEK